MRGPFTSSYNTCDLDNSNIAYRKCFYAHDAIENFDGRTLPARSPQRLRLSVDVPMAIRSEEKDEIHNAGFDATDFNLSCKNS